jgi:hypothetical protein
MFLLYNNNNNNNNTIIIIIIFKYGTTDALHSNFIGTTTLHVSGSLSGHHQEFLADVRLRTPDDGQKGCPKHVDS